jgi:RHS repeat-associated protein
VARACTRKPQDNHLPRQNLKRSSHRNQQYSITALTDGSGSVVERYAYTAYGQVTFANASGTVQAASASNNRYTYTGREWDEGLSLFHYRARMYDAVGGRFCSKDPIAYEDSYLLFMFARGSPATYLDFDGLTARNPNISPGPWLQREVTSVFASIQSSVDNTLSSVRDSASSLKDTALSAAFAWKSRASSKGCWHEDVRWKKKWGSDKFGFNIQGGFYIKACADCRCINVTVGGFGQIEGKLPFVWGSNFVGRGSASLQYRFKYCLDGTFEDGGEVNVSFSAGLQYQFGAVTRFGGAKLTAEAGFGFGWRYPLPRGPWESTGLSVYGRVYAEWQTGWWGSYRRRDFRYVYGGPLTIY